MENCVFCKIVKGELPTHKIYENDQVLVIMDIMPLNDGHILVLPKEHHETIFDISEELAAEIMRVAWKMAGVIKKVLKPDGMNIVQNNCKVAFQVVPHYHVHLIPRSAGDNIKLGSWPAKEQESEKLTGIARRLSEALHPSKTSP